MKITFAFLLLALGSAAQANDQFTLQADYANSELKALRFDYRPQRPSTGVTVNGKLVPGSGCFARIPGSDNLTKFLESIKDQPGYYAIADTRKRMQDAMVKTKLDIWQEVLCVATGTFAETVKANPGKWSSIPIYLDGQRQGAWNEVFTVVRPNHLYSITVHPRRTTSDPAYEFGR
jgi:hypothetical protein